MTIHFKELQIQFETAHNMCYLKASFDKPDVNMNAIINRHTCIQSVKIKTSSQ